MKVRTVKFEEHRKVFRLYNDASFTAHRYCCLGSGDDLIVRSQNRSVVRCLNGDAVLVPAYRGQSKLTFGGRTLSLVVKEAVSREEIDGYHRLEAYHYRGTALHGRRVPLVICSSDPLLPTVLGYVELSTAFMMNKPRATMFDAEFKDRSGIAWTQWNKDAVRRFTNVVVRIARCVVSPEFRGLGVARILVEHAARFARTHWNVGRLRPLFLEITADMLRYVPFVESAGMLYVGETEGNLARVNKDMNYILKNYSRMKSREILKEESAGIVDLQVFYASRIHDIEKAQGIDREKLLKLLIRAPHRLSDEHWSLLHRVYRSPKPTFLLGLSGDSQAFVERRLKELGLTGRYQTNRPQPLDPDPSPKAIVVSNCGYKVESSLLRTKATRKVQEAFGIHKEMLSTTLFSNLSFKVAPGEIVLLCGPSGAGKTTLLSVLRKALTGADKAIPGMQGEVRVSKHAKVASLEPLPNNLPLISSLGPHCSLDDALYALSLSGLAEAQLYVKRFRDLSNGQRYRAMVAKLMASRASVWLADEFCATLDPVTANIVARNLRRSAEALRASVIVAAANWSEFIEELRPDLVIHLRSPWEFRVFRWKAFRSAVMRSKLIL
jgi:ABC-type ATPase with predicted acetyltransferase domain